LLASVSRTSQALRNTADAGVPLIDPLHKPTQPAHAGSSPCAQRVVQVLGALLDSIMQPLRLDQWRLNCQRLCHVFIRMDGCMIELQAVDVMSKFDGSPVWLSSKRPGYRRFAA
jgi:hypothetical protein